MDRLGLLDASTLIAGYSRDGDRRAVAAGLYFEGPRRGMAAWLAEPAAMGTLDFFSPQASFAAAAVSQDPVQMFDELLGAVTAAEPEALAELEQFQSAVGIDLRADIAATLGGEAAFAVDGPVLPRPSWKLVVEVYDPDTLRHTIEQAVAQINTQIESEGHTGLTMADRSAGGRTYTEIRHDASGVQIVYLMVDGFMVVAPDAALIDQALQYRASGVTLPRSAAFRDLLPDDGRTGCSALVWRNLGDLVEALPSEALSQLPPEATVLLGENSEPGLWCAYGERDRIVASGTGESLLASVPAFGLSEILRGHAGRTETSDGPLSSAG
jgi:hypothetical protein